MRPSSVSIRTPQPTPQYGQADLTAMSLQVDIDIAFRHFHGKALHFTFVRRDGAAGVQLDARVVQRTGDALAEHDALRQRPAAMRAAVRQREELVVGGAEDRDVRRDTPAHDPRAEAR